MSPPDTTSSLLSAIQARPFGDLVSAITDDRRGAEAVVGLAVAAEALAEAGMDPVGLTRGLGLLGTSQGYRSVGIWKHRTDDEGIYEMYARWRAVDDEVPDRLDVAQTGLEGVHRTLRAGGISEVRVGDGPLTDAVLDRFGDESLLIVPVSGLNGYWGAAMFASTKGDTAPWGPQSRSCLRSFAAIVSSSVKHHQQAQQTHRLRAALSMSMREEGLATLAAGIAHDVGNLLSVMRTGMDLAVVKGEMDPTAAERLDRAVESASAMVGQLYTFAGMEPRRQVSIDVKRLVRRNLKLIEPTLPPSTVIALEFPPEVPLVTGNVTQVGQIIGNLVLNAIEALGDAGGSVVIGARAHARHVPGLLIWVEDDGPGVSGDIRKTIFEPLSSTKGARRGIGLASAASLARAHHGHLCLSNRPGPGARFEIWLPAVPPE